jgi:ABC-type Fe3+ transport system permease subunit
VLDLSHLSEPVLLLASILGAMVALLLLAALKTIPDAHFRAARMDGAGVWQSFRYVTLPAIRPTLLIATVLRVTSGCCSQVCVCRVSLCVCCWCGPAVSGTI